MAVKGVVVCMRTFVCMHRKLH